MGDRVEGGTGPQTADTAIMASINCVIFNHVNYIGTALDSLLMQKTDSALEILIHDDASTDKISSIIREYAARCPDRVKSSTQTENQYSQGTDNISGAFNFPRARGKYIFMCDGDDYFLSPDKLQKQVDCMEAHLDCTLCIHSAKADLVGRMLTGGQMRPYRESRALPPKEIIDRPSGYATSSMALPARPVRELPDYYVDCPMGNTSIQLIAAANGYGYYFDDAMSAYRVGVADSWTVEGKNGDYQGKQKTYYDRMKRTYEQFDRAIGGRFREAVKSVTCRIYYQTMVDTKQSEEILNPQYCRYYKELTPRMRLFLRFEHTTPVVYEIARKAFIGK